MRKLRWENHKYHIELLREYYALNKYCWTEQLKDAILDAIDCLIYVDECQKMEDGILNATTADDVPVVHAKWLRSTNIDIFYSCSKCGKTVTKTAWCNSLSNYCPDCGARMDGIE